MGPQSRVQKMADLHPLSEANVLEPNGSNHHPLLFATFEEDIAGTENVNTPM